MAANVCLGVFSIKISMFSILRLDEITESERWKGSPGLNLGPTAVGRVWEKDEEIDKDSEGGTHKVGGKTDELGTLEARRESVQEGMMNSKAVLVGVGPGEPRPLDFSVRRPLVTLTGAVLEGGRRQPEPWLETAGTDSATVMLAVKRARWVK